jgi:hypothetical protein
VTSNYQIKELWKDDPVLVEAISRRFLIVRKTSQDQLMANAQGLIYNN